MPGTGSHNPYNNEPSSVTDAMVNIFASHIDKNTRLVAALHDVLDVLKMLDGRITALEAELTVGEHLKRHEHGSPHYGRERLG